MAPVIRLDRSKPFSECRGDRTPDDPHYKVCFMQSAKVNGQIVQLPFDASDELVPDDGATEPRPGLNAEGKPITYYPLYSPLMRELVKAKLQKLVQASNAAVNDGPPELVIEEGAESDPFDDVNFSSWLKGETKYDWMLLQGAAKKRYGRVFQSKRQMVEDLVCDEQVIPEAQVCAELQKHLPPKAA